MTERERLIELLMQGDIAAAKQGVFNCCMCRREAETIADYLLENGVIVPPVKAGDTIYEIHERRKGGEWVKIISERFVHGVEIYAGGCMIARCGSTISVFLSDIGKTVFLTREEAEKALKESEDNA